MAGNTIVGFLTVLIMFIAMGSMFIVWFLRTKKVPLGQAMVVFGRLYPGGKSFQIIPFTSQRPSKYILPIVEAVEFLRIEERVIDLDLDNVLVDAAGEPRRVRLGATASVRISDEPVNLRTAAEHLLGKPDDDVDWIARRTIEGVVCQYLAASAIEDIEADLEPSSERIRALARQELVNIGIEVLSFTIDSLKVKG